MVSIDDLVHEMNEASNRAALAYSIGEYKLGDECRRECLAASDAIERMTERAVVREVGVS